MSLLPRQGNPTVSVVLATYNGEKYIEQQLSSIYHQSLQPTQIVIADDGSRDGTLRLIHNFVDYANSTDGHRLPSIRVDFLASAGNLGVAANFYRALQVCIGDFIALSDQDDVWRHDKLEVLVTALTKQPDALLAFSNARLVDENNDPLSGSLFTAIGLSGRERERIQSDQALDILLRRNIVTGATVLLRRELVKTAGPIPSGWIHDEWLAFIASLQSGLVCVDEPLIDYRQHSANVIGASRLTMKKRLSKLSESRMQRNRRLLERAQSQTRWVELNSVDAQLITRVQQKLFHEQVRSRLPLNRGARLVPVLTEACTGRYREYGLGLQDILRDIVQPA